MNNTLSELQQKKKEALQKAATKQKELEQVLSEIADREIKLSDIEKEIQTLKLSLGMTPEEKAKLDALDQKIAALQAEVKKKEEAIPPLRTKIEEKEKQQADLLAEQNSINAQIRTWQERLKTAQALKQRWIDIVRAKVRETGKTTWDIGYATESGLEYWKNLIMGKIETWRNIYLWPQLGDFLKIWNASLKWIRIKTQSTGITTDKVEIEILIGRIDKSIPTPRIKIPAIKYDSGIVKSQRDLEYALQRLVDYAQERLSSLQNRFQDITFNLNAVRGELISLRSQLSSAEYDLEATKRLLEDTISAKKRVELEIRRAIALRQAEFDAAKKRYELEKRQLDTLKKTVEYLKAEIEAAKAEAVRIAAQYDEALARAKEEERLRIAEEQRKRAEEAEKKAEETAGREKISWKEQLRKIEEAMKKAKDAAEKAALERQRKAILVAIAQAEEAAKKVEAEMKGKELKIAAPPLPKWGWVVGLGAIATFIGIGIAKKRKKR